MRAQRAPWLRRWARDLSVGLSATAEGKPLKAVLRQLYKRIHPDLFTDSPVEQAVNEKSFATLQEWLALAASGSEPQGRSRVVDLQFYVRPGEQDTEGGSPAPLRHVALSLPPPGRRIHGPSDKQVAGSLTPTAAKALRKLFDALGMEVDDACLEGSSSSGTPGLLDILPEATEAIRQAESSARSADDLIRMARAALRMTRGIMLSFAAGAPPGTRVHLSCCSTRRLV